MNELDHMHQMYLSDFGKRVIGKGVCGWFVDESCIVRWGDLDGLLHDTLKVEGM